MESTDLYPMNIVMQNEELSGLYMTKEGLLYSTRKSNKYRYVKPNNDSYTVTGLKDNKRYWFHVSDLIEGLSNHIENLKKFEKKDHVDQTLAKENEPLTLYVVMTGEPIENIKESSIEVFNNIDDAVEFLKSDTFPKYAYVGTLTNICKAEVNFTLCDS